MEANHDNTHEQIQTVYGETARAAVGVMWYLLQALNKAFPEPDLEVSQQKQFDGNDLSVERNDNYPQLTIERNDPPARNFVNKPDLSIEENAPENAPETIPLSGLDEVVAQSRSNKAKTQAESNQPDRSEPLNPSPKNEPPKVLFGMVEDRFVNTLSSAQELGIAKMLMSEPGTQIPGAENLTVRYKGEIVARTNAEGILETNLAFGKIPAAELQQLQEAIANTPKTAAPAIETKPIPAAEVATKEPPAKPILKNQLAEQIATAVSNVATPENQAQVLSDQIMATAPPSIQPTGKFQDEHIEGVKNNSKDKVAGIVNWIESNVDPQTQIATTPNGFIAKLEATESGSKQYSLETPNGTNVLSGSLNSGKVEISNYDSKGIGTEWTAMKAQSSKAAELESTVETVERNDPKQVNRSTTTTISREAEPQTVVATNIEPIAQTNLKIRQNNNQLADELTAANGVAVGDAPVVAAPAAEIATNNLPTTQVQAASQNSKGK
ncbi:MAG: hypothetical protein HC778_00770 [Chamaesiphon sp. CSU_1_12]|nr:hypothetical protein [Chamaesiphon sp. CSU_1_12]